MNGSEILSFKLAQLFIIILCHALMLHKPFHYRLSKTLTVVGNSVSSISVDLTIH